MNKEKQRESKRLYRLKNKERIKEYNNYYRLQNKEYFRKYQTKYRKTLKFKNFLKEYYSRKEVKENKKLYYKTPKYLEKNKIYKLLNADKIKERNRLYRLKNKYKIKQYQLNNRHLLNAIAARRKATKLKATPKFANLNKIKEIYKNCPKGYHVDHIIPLQSKLVCGLHVEWNLQYLPAKENLSKYNKVINYNL